MKFDPKEMTDEKIESCLAFAARIVRDCVAMGTAKGLPPHLEAQRVALEFEKQRRAEIAYREWDGR
jgi:hypothetical protein